MWFVVDLLIDLLGVLASYSITVNELRTLFSLLRVAGNKWVSSSVIKRYLINEINAFTLDVNTFIVEVNVAEVSQCMSLYSFDEHR